LKTIHGLLLKMRRFEPGLSLAFAVCCLLATASAQVVDNGTGGSYRPDEEGKFLIGVRRTNVITTISTTTLTVGATCLNQVNGGTCTGRRRRGLTNKASVGINRELSDALDGSKASEDDIAWAASEQIKERLVIWTTSTSTVTFTSSSTASGTTLTLNYSCTAAGVSFPPACG